MRELRQGISICHEPEAGGGGVGWELTGGMYPGVYDGAEIRRMGKRSAHEAGGKGNEAHQSARKWDQRLEQHIRNFLGGRLHIGTTVDDFRASLTPTKVRVELVP